MLFCTITPYLYLSFSAVKYVLRWLQFPIIIDMELSPNMTDNGNKTTDTPRTSNLKFLRAKRLSYFSEKSSRTSLFTAEKPESLVASKNHRPAESHKPQRCLSAPALNPRKDMSATSKVQKRNSFDTNTANSCEETVDARTSEMNNEIQETGKQSTSEVIVQQNSPSSPRVDSNLHIASETFGTEPSVHIGLQESLEELQDTPINKHVLQPASKETAKEPPIQQNVEPTLENGSKIISMYDFDPQEKEVKIEEHSIYHLIPEQSRIKESLINYYPNSEPNIDISRRSNHCSLESKLASDPENLENLSRPTLGKLKHITKEAPIYYPIPEKSMPKEPSINRYPNSKPDVEIIGHSSHRSLLRSSLVSDLDQRLLEDVSVPESEKLQHVMLWAKKFLKKCGGGNVLDYLDGDSGGSLTTVGDKASEFQPYQSSRTGNTFLKMDVASSSSTLQHDADIEYDASGINKQTLGNDSKKTNNLRSTFKIKSDFNNSRTETLDSSFSKQHNFTFKERPVSPLSESEQTEYQNVKSFNSMYPHKATNELGTDEFRNKMYLDLSKQSINFKEEDYDVDGVDMFESHGNYNMKTFRIKGSDDNTNNLLIAKDDDASSSNSSLDTERINALLDNLDKLQKVTEKKEQLEIDGSRTGRTYLVNRSVGSEDNTTLNNVVGRVQPSSYKTYKTISLSEDSDSKRFRVCTVCSYSNTTKTSWCEECGSILRDDKDQTSQENLLKELPRPHKKTLDNFLNVKNETGKHFEETLRKKPIHEERKTALCWEDKSDVLSDSDGSVLEKYFHCVKQLDMLKSQVKTKQSKDFQGDQFCDISSEDESSAEHPKHQNERGTINDYLPKTIVIYDVPSDSDESGQSLEACGRKPDTYLFYQQARVEKHFGGSTENIHETESKLKPLDRKQQKPQQKSSKATGPKRHWEKSSIAWSSYTHGELKSRNPLCRSLQSIQRPSSADPTRRNGQCPGGKALDLDPSTKMTRQIQRPSSTSHNKTAEYKNVAAAYMKTANAWAVTEHICRRYSASSSHHLPWNPEENDGSVWLLLPDELWIYILKKLTHKDLSKVAQVCQRFRYIANDDSLWKVIKITNCHSLDDNCLLNIGLHHPESLSLHRCHDDNQSITQDGLGKVFQHCKASLTELNVTNCSGPSFEGDVVLSCASGYCTNLTSVDISWTGTTDKGISAIVDGVTRLKALSINGCKITDQAITALLKKHSKSLIKLEVFGCHALTAHCLISLTTECSHLENLNIGRVPKVTDVCLTKIASNLHKMNTLNLTGLNVVRDRAVHVIVKQCPKLENLTLSSCSQVTDVSLVEISTYLRTIKYLDVSGCKKISDIGIQALARSCQQICSLDLSSTGTGKRGVCLLASYSYTSLECLKLSFCKEITADAIQKLCKNCKRLKTLHLYGCRISPDLEHIKKLSKSIHILHDLSIPTVNI
ncbi:uncharacterized protein [Hyperolius riggenbachi]|uniref:uncharacterized protein n=1 Tax=Hyperolius riggenbachi TaxID=752182 RepID=UPI0035A36B75